MASREFTPFFLACRELARSHGIHDISAVMIWTRAPPATNPNGARWEYRSTAICLFCEQTFGYGTPLGRHVNNCPYNPTAARGRRIREATEVALQQRPRPPSRAQSSPSTPTYRRNSQDFQPVLPSPPLAFEGGEGPAMINNSQYQAWSYPSEIGNPGWTPPQPTPFAPHHAQSLQQPHWDAQWQLQQHHQQQQAAAPSVHRGPMYMPNTSQTSQTQAWHYTAPGSVGASSFQPNPYQDDPEESDRRSSGSEKRRRR